MACVTRANCAHTNSVVHVVVHTSMRMDVSWHHQIVGSHHSMHDKVQHCIYG